MKSKHETEDFYKYSSGDKLYEDPDFPADKSSLYWPKYEWDGDMPPDYDEKVTGWARPTELVRQARYKQPAKPDAEPSLWGSGGIQPNGTNQGGLGDCWFLAAASALAEYPDRVKKLFSNDSYDAAGIFQVNFWFDGEKTPITVDDRIPIKEGKDKRYQSYGVKSPVNSHMSMNGAWW